MTDLVERLNCDCDSDDCTFKLAKDRIEQLEAEVKTALRREAETTARYDAKIDALEAEIEKLREALGWFLNDSRFVVQVGGNPYVVPQMIEAARAALGEKQ